MAATKQITLTTPEQNNSGVPTWDLVRIMSHTPGASKHTVKWSTGKMAGGVFEESIGRKQRTFEVDNLGYRSVGVPSFVIEQTKKDVANAWTDNISGKTDAEIEAYILGLLQERSLVGAGVIGDI
jgi:hypothetical protein